MGRYRFPACAGNDKMGRRGGLFNFETIGNITTRQPDQAGHITIPAACYNIGR